MISDNAVIETSDIGENVQIADFSVIRAGARIGANVRIHEHVVINPGVVLGDGVEVFAGAIVGKEPRSPGTLSNAPTFERRVEIGAGSQIGSHARIYYDVEIGEQTLVGDGATIREASRIGARCIVGINSVLQHHVTVGDDTRLQQLTNLAPTTRVGRQVFVGPMVATTDSNALGREPQPGDKDGGVTLSDRCHIGAGARFLPGVLVGEDALIGAGAVVTKDVAPGSTVMGVPAKVVTRAE